MGIKYNPLIFSGFDFTGGGTGIVFWQNPVATEGDLPIPASQDGEARVVKDTDKIYIWDATTSKWIDTGIALAAFGDTSPEGLSTGEVVDGDIIRRTLQLNEASATTPGGVSIETQSFAGDKTFVDVIYADGGLNANVGGISVYTIDTGETGPGDTLNIGVVNADTINIGQDGISVNINGNVSVDYTPAVPSDWSPAPSDVMPALDQLAARMVGRDELVKEPTGFPNLIDSSISFVDGTRTFTIQPTGASFDFYIKGHQFTKSAPESLVIPNLPGDHYIYYNNLGALTSTQAFSPAILQDYAFVSIVYWNTDTSKHSYFAEERHGLIMDGMTHTYLHTVFGARFISGLALQGFNVDSSGNLNSSAQFTSDQGSIRDEDLLHQLLAQSQIPILYRQGQLWRRKAPGIFPLVYSGDSTGYVGANNRIPFNEYTGGAWQLTQANNSYYVLVHFFGTNDKDNGVVGIQGIAQYNGIGPAREGANAEIVSLSGLPFAEFVPIGSVIFETLNAFSNTPKARVVSTDTGADYVDFRGSQLYVPSGQATTHGLLSGLAVDDHLQYLLTDGSRLLSGDFQANNHKINNLADGTDPTDAINLSQLTDAITDTPSTFAGFNDVGTLAPVPGWTFDDTGATQIGAQNSLVIPPGTTDFVTLSLSPSVNNTGLGTLNGIQLNQAINQPVNAVTAIQVYGYGLSSASNYTSFASQPGFNGSTDNFKHFSASSSSDIVNLYGFDFNSISNVENETGINIASSGDVSNTYTGVLIDRNGSTGNFTGVSINSSDVTGNFAGIEITGLTASCDNASGLIVDLTGVTSTTRKIGASITGGSLQQSDTFQTTSNLPELVANGNLFRNTFQITSGDEITDADVILNNLSGFMQLDGTHHVGSLNVGITSVGFVSQVASSGTEVIDSITMSLGAIVIDSTSTGGTVTDAHIYRGFVTSFGGTITLDNLYGLRLEDGMSTYASNTWGISVEDTSAENFISKSLVIGGPSKVVNDQDIALEIQDPKSLRLGNTDTSQRTSMVNYPGALVFDTDELAFYGNDGINWLNLNPQVLNTDTVANANIIGSPTQGINVTSLLAHCNSTTSLDGFEITDNGDGSVDVASGEILIRDSNSTQSPLYAASVSSDMFILTDNATNYICVDYNSGTPILVDINDFSLINGLTQVILFSISREGTELNIIDARDQGTDTPNKRFIKDIETKTFEVTKGSAILGNPSLLYLNVTASKIYYGVQAITASAFDTSIAGTANANVFRYYYRNGSGGFTKVSSVKSVDANHYDNGTGTLAVTNTNKYTVHWVYLIPDTPGKLAVVYGTAEYNTPALAASAALPTQLPSVLTNGGLLIGRVIAQQGQTTPNSVVSAFTTTFTAATAGTHNVLSGLQGGAANDYYHLTASHYNTVTDLANLTNGQVLIGRTGLSPLGATLTAGSGISITNGAGSIGIACSVPPSAGDIARTGFTIADNQVLVANIPGFVFSNAVTRGFEAQVTIVRGSTYAEYSLKGIQKGSSWDMSQDYIGDDTGVVFTITAAGQIQYTSTNTGSTAALLFRAQTV